MLESPPKIAIVILAAGASKRMGSPKQLLKWGDQTLIEHSIKEAQGVNSKSVLVVLGANFDLIKNHIQDDSQITILNNPRWEQGLGTSIAIAVEYLQNSKSSVDGVLITLCDQPLITSDYLSLLISKFKSGKNQIIATSYGNGKHGVPALFDKVYFNELMGLNDDQGARDILKRQANNVIGVAPPESNVDLDTKEDYSNLYQLKFKE
jgi:molybdenum cofactor cytidylyltransferase